MKKSNKISAKTIARISAIQTLYQYEQEDRQQDSKILIQKILDFYKDDDLSEDLELNTKNPIKIKLSVNYFTGLVKFTIENLKLMDETISNHLAQEWKINDLPPLLLAVLRVGACELKFFPETPCKVVINEYTDITSDMLTDNEVGFVNSVLDKLAKQCS